jgi:hypothetical protein
MKNKALKYLPKNRRAILCKQDISSWTEGDIHNVLDNVANLYERIFEEDEDVEDSTRI